NILSFILLFLLCFHKRKGKGNKDQEPNNQFFVNLYTERLSTKYHNHRDDEDEQQRDETKVVSRHVKAHFGGKLALGD
ncbi:hypothetical protein ACI3UL_004973, partial [Escherichia coli]|uniref:hypothetical protein n=1 Tax=Klebsiella pneumoniae TaxID=573 RepID=UPI0021D87C1C